MSEDLTIFDYSNRFNPYVPPNASAKMTSRQEDFQKFLFNAVEKIFDAEPRLIHCTPIENINQLSQLMHDTGDVYHQISLIQTSEEFESKVISLVCQIIRLKVRADLIILEHAKSASNVTTSTNAI